MLVIDPGSPPALFRLSLLQAREGRYQAALTLARRVFDSIVGNSTALYQAEQPTAISDL